MSDRYRLKLGERQSLAPGVGDEYDIIGPHGIEVLRRIPAYGSILSVSKNPGIPIVWLGASAIGGPRSRALHCRWRYRCSKAARW